MNFEILWNNFPKREVMKLKCTNKQKDGNKPFSNYCAILLSECFIRSGVSTVAFKAKKCWSHAGQKHILLAEELANSLKNRTAKWFF